MIIFNQRLHLTVIMGLVGALYGLALSAQAQPKLELKVNTQPMARYTVAMGQSVLINTTNVVRQVSLAEPEIADSVLLSQRQLYVIGKKLGTTTLTLWDRRGHVTVLDIEVTPDIIGLKEKLWQVLPLEKDSLGVTAANGGLALFGKVSSTASLDRALALAELYAPEKVTNLMQVGGVHQVMLEVRVAEMQSTLTKRLGINFTALDGSTFFGLTTITALPSLSADFRFNAGDVSVTGLSDALKEDGLVKILAEPTLVALSGQEASFLAGGEFPILVPQDNGRITIEFRSFGVALGFTPTVISPDKISLQVAPEVSELDFANAVVLAGVRVPALTVRRASTVIELADGQSFAIAGLLQDKIREVIAKIPVLGSIPILGALFRSSSFEREETELVIIVTPRLVKPINVAAQPLPTDAYIEPNDIEFFLFGQLQGKGLNKMRQGKLDGAFGYISQP